MSGSGFGRFGYWDEVWGPISQVFNDYFVFRVWCEDVSFPCAIFRSSGSTSQLPSKPLVQTFFIFPPEPLQPSQLLLHAQ